MGIPGSGRAAAWGLGLAVVVGMVICVSLSKFRALAADNGQGTGTCRPEPENTNSMKMMILRWSQNNQSTCVISLYPKTPMLTVIPETVISYPISHCTYPKNTTPLFNP